ncbi:MAG: glycosyltransferase [Planctomycetia bacterium]|nr:glycosyltransferase [Planctomycetia bacterium]
MTKSKSKKLCLATTYNGTMLFYREMCTILRRNGWNVTLLAGGELEKFKSYQFCSDRQVFVPQLVRKPKPLIDFLCLCRLLVFFVFNRFDLVYVASPKAGLLVNLAARLTGHRVLYSIIGRAYEDFKGPKRAVYTLMERVSCLCARRVVAITPSLCQAILKDKCCPAKKLTQIHLRPGRQEELARFDPAQYSREQVEELRARYNVPLDATLLLFVGRLCRDKGVRELVKAFVELQKTNENLYLIMVGKDDDPNRLMGEQTWNELENNARIIRTGLMPREAVPLFYCACDIFVCPTYREARSAVGIEAARLERPVVLTDAVGARDSLIDGQTGIMVPTRQVEPLVAALQRLIDSPQLRRQMGRAGRQFVLDTIKRTPDAVIVNFIETVAGVAPRGQEYRFDA